MDTPVTISLEDAEAFLDYHNRNGFIPGHGAVGRLADAIVESRTHDDNHNITASARSTYATYDHDRRPTTNADPDDAHNECLAYAEELKHSLRGDG